LIHFEEIRGELYGTKIMDSTSDAEAGHLLAHLSTSGGHASPYTNGTHHNQLTPASSAPGISPSSSHAQQSGSPSINQHQHQNGSGNGNGSTVKRSRQRPTKSCEECRRKKLKCDRELPCSNCKKGGRDGSTCYFKDVPTSEFPSASKRVRLDEGFEERERRPYGGVGYGDGREGEMEGGARGYYPNVPTLARNDPIGSGRGVLPYGINGMSGVDAEIDAIRATQKQQEVVQRRLDGDWERHPNVPDAERKSSFAFKRRTLPWPTGEAAGGRRDEMPTPVSSSGLVQETVARALGRVHVKGTRSRYVGIGDRMAIMDHVSLFSCSEILTNDGSLTNLKALS
jgi:hypothetical protein